MRSITLARKIGQLALTKKASNVIVMDLRKLTAVADYFVLCSADSDVQVRAVAEAVEEGMEKAGASLWHREAGSANWILLDYVDVVLHVFHKHTRSFYNLERLWGDADIVTMEDIPPVKKTRKVTATATRKPRKKKAV